MAYIRKHLIIITILSACNVYYYHYFVNFRLMNKMHIAGLVDLVLLSSAKTTTTQSPTENHWPYTFDCGVNSDASYATIDKKN